MKQQSSQYLSSRVLKLNIGYMLEGQKRSQDTNLDIPRVRISEDLIAEYVRGSLRLSRTKEGILVQGTLDVGVVGECYRCIEPVSRPLQLVLEELFATSDQLAVEEAEFRVHEDGQLDLAPLIRAESLIQQTRGLRCEDVDACDRRMKALEAEAGIDHIDPRLAKLRELLNSDGEQ